jgi:hypothetical protein
LIAIAFADKINQTINKINITSNEEFSNDKDPTPF